MKKYSRKNGWFKFYNNQGKFCRIKLNNNILKDTKVIIKFKYDNSSDWYYHSPDRKFNGCQDVIWYITNNLESDKMLFEINNTRLEIGKI